MQLSSPSTPTLRTLGSIELIGPDARSAAAIISQPKRLALLVILAAESGLVRRDRLLPLLWPELSEPRARAALSTSLSYLRRFLGDGVITNRGAQEVGVDPRSLQLDVNLFQAALAEGRDADAVELCRGEFLPGLHLSANGAFAEWLDDRRRGLKADVVAASKRWAHTCRSAGDKTGEEAAIRGILSLAPYDEGAIGELVRLMAARGDRAGALVELDAFAARMLADLDLEVSSELAAVADLIRNSNATGGAGEVPDRGSQRAEMGVELAREAAAAEALGLPSHSTTADRPISERVVSNHRSALLWTAVAAVIVTVLALNWGGSGSPPPSRPVVIVVPLANETGDPELDVVGRVAADWITTGLSRTTLADVISQFTLLGRSLGYEENPPGARSPTPIDLARDYRATHLISGSFRPNGEELVFQATVTHVPSSAVVRAVDGIMGPRDDPLEAVDALGRRITGALGTAIDERLESWSHLTGRPPTFDAYRLFARAMDLFTRAPNAAARLPAAQLFAAAAEADSTFVMAQIWQAFALAAEPEARKSVLAAILARHDLTAFEEAVARHQWAGMHEHPREWYAWTRRIVDMAPETEWRYKLALAARWAGYPAEAASVLEQVQPEGWLAGGWGEVTVRDVLGLSYLNLGRFDDVWDLYRERPVRPEDHDAYLPAYTAAAQGDSARLGQWLHQYDRWLAEDRIDIARVAGIRTSVAQVANVVGHAVLAEEQRRANRDWFEAWLANENQHWPDLQGRILYEAGEYDLAGSKLEEAYCVGKSPEGRECWLWRGLIAAKHSDESTARAALGQLEYINEVDGLRDRARIRVALGEVSEARALLHRYLSEGGKGVGFQSPEWRPLWPSAPFEPEPGFERPMDAWTAWILQMRRGL